MKSLVTGGAGFIGSHLVDSLIKRGDEVVVFDNFSSGKKEFLNKNAELFKGDITDIESVKKSMKGIDMVWHLAANPDIRYGAKKTDLDLNQNTIGTYNILEAMRLNDVKKIALASSSTVYGEPSVNPVPENYGPLVPISLYGASKLAGEALLTAFNELFDFDVWIFRFANIIGTRLTHGVIYDFYEKLKRNKKELEILGNGTQSKSYLLTEECVSGMIFVTDKIKNGVNIYNLGCDDQCSVKRIAEIVSESLGLDPEFRYTGGDRGWKGDVPQVRLDVNKINTLGWKAKHNSEEAVKITAKWVSDNI